VHLHFEGEDAWAAAADGNIIKLGLDGTVPSSAPARSVGGLQIPDNAHCGY
jgi:hypothetical protein